MTDLSDFAESLGIRWLMTDQVAARPTEWWVALYNVTPSDTGGGTEVSGTGYGRQEATFTEASGIASTDTDLTFTATGAWGTINAVGVFDAETSGNLLLWKVVSSPFAVISGQAVIASAGTLTARLA